jgi:hypothetical protein
LQVSSPYLAWAFVGGSISGVRVLKKTDFRPGRQGTMGSKRSDMLWRTKASQSLLTCTIIAVLLVVCPCGLGFSSGSPLPGNAVLGPLSSPPLRFLGAKANVYQKFRKKVFHQGNLCYPGIVVRIRLQEQKPWGFFPGKRSHKPFLDCGGHGCCIISLRVFSDS